MSLINCEINLFLTRLTTYVITNSFAITDTKSYVSDVTLPTQTYVKLLVQLKSCFNVKKRINWNKY